VFLASVIYLPLLLGLMVADRASPSELARTGGGPTVVSAAWGSGR
jgi:hypothetical protein